jgi:hypothetical protein
MSCIYIYIYDISSLRVNTIDSPDDEDSGARNM